MPAHRSIRVLACSRRHDQFGLPGDVRRRASRKRLRRFSDIWSVTSFTELRREGLGVQRWKMLHSHRNRLRFHSSPPCEHDLARKRLHDFANLIARDVAQRSRCLDLDANATQNLRILAFDLKRIADTRRPRPPEFAARADDAAGDRHTLDDEPHRDRRRMPSARREAAKQRVARSIFIQMEWLRIIRGSEGLLISPASTVFEGG